jgi:hypothetical protein
MEEAQDILLAQEESEQQIVSGSTRRAAARPASVVGGGTAERRLGFIEGVAGGEDRVITVLQQSDQAGFERVESDAALGGEVCGEPQPPAPGLPSPADPGLQSGPPPSLTSGGNHRGSCSFGDIPV